MKCFGDFETRGMGTKPTFVVRTIDSVVDPIIEKYSDKLKVYNDKRASLLKIYNSTRRDEKLKAKLLVDIFALDKENAPLLTYDSYIKGLGIKIGMYKKVIEDIKANMAKQTPQLENSQAELAKLMELVAIELKK